MSALLSVEGLSVHFGGVKALSDVNLHVTDGTIHGLIGPNGAGKTTLLNCIGRVIHPDAGAITLDGASLLARAPHELPALGIARTFQNLALMEDSSVLENVLLGVGQARRQLRLQDFFPTRQRALAAEEDRHIAYTFLERLGLQSQADTRISVLPYGMRKSVEIARALCAGPRLLLLDEPTAGLNSKEMSELADAVHKLRAQLDITILLITHHIEFLLNVAERVTVLDLGSVIAEGTPDLVHTDERVRFAYLGAEE
jgi:branched-chain amino acid transport system ATP-binding protein